MASASRDAHEPDDRPCDANGRPTRLLFLALLHDAIDCFRKHLLDPSRRGRRLFAEAETWLMDDHTSLPLGFETSAMSSISTPPTSAGACANGGHGSSPSVRDRHVDPTGGRRYSCPRRRCRAPPHSVAS